MLPKGGFRMKRVISFLAVLCLALSVFSTALAAITITQQPTSQTVKAGGSVTFTVKAKGASGQSVTWYFTNPATGETTTGRKLSSVVSGVKVTGPNSLKVTIKKVPESMHGWLVYCHIGQKNKGVDTDTVMILIAGLEPPEMPVQTASTAGTSAQSGTKTTAATAAGSTSGTGTATEDTTAVVASTVVEEPEPVVITGKKVELYKLDASGQKTGTAQTELTFAPKTKASFYVQLPEGTDGTLEYLTVDGMRLTPDTEVTGMAISGVDHSITVRAKVKKAGSEGSSGKDTLAELAELQQQEQEALENAASMATVTCTYCRFSGGGYFSAQSGQVPVGTRIVVQSDGGNIGIRNSDGNYPKKSGYFINGEKTSVHRGESSFQMVVEGDTTVTMNPQP